MKILVRDFDNDPWEKAEFEKFNSDTLFPVKASGVNWMQAIPYFENYENTKKKWEKTHIGLKMIYKNFSQEKLPEKQSKPRRHNRNTNFKNKSVST